MHSKFYFGLNRVGESTTPEIDQVAAEQPEYFGTLTVAKVEIVNRRSDCCGAQRVRALGDMASAMFVSADGDRTDTVQITHAASHHAAPPHTTEQKCGAVPDSSGTSNGAVADAAASGEPPMFKMQMLRTMGRHIGYFAEADECKVVLDWGLLSRVLSFFFDPMQALSTNPPEFFDSATGDSHHK